MEDSLNTPILLLYSILWMIVIALICMATELNARQTKIKWGKMNKQEAIHHNHKIRPKISSRAERIRTRKILNCETGSCFRDAASLSDEDDHTIAKETAKETAWRHANRFRETESRSGDKKNKRSINLCNISNALYKGSKTLRIPDTTRNREDPLRLASQQITNKYGGCASVEAYSYVTDDGQEDNDYEFLMYSDFDAEFDSDIVSGSNFDPEACLSRYVIVNYNREIQDRNEEDSYNFSDFLEEKYSFCRLKLSTISLQYEYEKECLYISPIIKMLDQTTQKKSTYFLQCTRALARNKNVFLKNFEDIALTVVVDPSFQNFMHTERGIAKSWKKKSGYESILNYKKHSYLSLVATQGYIFLRRSPVTTYVVLPVTSHERNQIVSDSSNTCSRERDVQLEPANDDLEVECREVNNSDQGEFLAPLGQIPAENSLQTADNGNVERIEPDLAPLVGGLNVERRIDDLHVDDSTEGQSSFFSNVSLSSVEEDETYHYEWFRLKTFSNWPLNSTFSTTLARNGWIALGQGDKAQCYSCHVVHEGWKVGENPEKFHDFFCRFLQGQSSNVPIYREPSRQSSTPRPIYQDQQPRVPEFPNLWSTTNVFQRFPEGEDGTASEPQETNMGSSPPENDTFSPREKQETNIEHNHGPNCRRESANNLIIREPSRECSSQRSTHQRVSAHRPTEDRIRLNSVQEESLTYMAVDASSRSEIRNHSQHYDELQDWYPRGQTNDFIGRQPFIHLSRSVEVIPEPEYRDTEPPNINLEDIEDLVLEWRGSESNIFEYQLNSRDYDELDFIPLNRTTHGSYNSK